MEKGEGHHHRGKSLDEINISVDEAISDEENQSDKEDHEEHQLSDKEDTEEQQLFDNYDEEVEHQTSQKPKEKLHKPKHQKPSKLKKKVNIIPWTNKEKTTAITFFKKHIDLKKVPNKKECEDLIKLTPSLFLNKTWRKIKYFIHNYINSKKIK